MAGQHRWLFVVNRSELPIHRGRFVFAPKRAKTVMAKKGTQLSEIKACRYFTVTDLGPAEIGDEMPTKVFDENNGRNLPRGTTTSRPETDPNVEYDGNWSPGTEVGDEGAIGSGHETVYTGLDKPANLETAYTGVEAPEREDVDLYPKTDPSAQVMVAYEEQKMPQLRAIAKERGVTMKPAMTKSELIDALKATDTGTEKNTHRRLDSSDVRFDTEHSADAPRATAPDDESDIDLLETDWATGQRVTADAGALTGEGDFSQPDDSAEVETLDTDWTTGVRVTDDADADDTK